MNNRMRILIAYDGSNGSDAILADLEKGGFPTEVEAIVISVADVFLWPGAGTQVDSTIAEHPRVAAAHKQALQAVEQAQALAAKFSGWLESRFPSWKVSTEAHGDSPAWAIIQKANAWKPDLLVVGSHGHSALGRLLLGSVAQKVTAETQCSVRVARAGTGKSNLPVRIVIGMDGSVGAEAVLDAVAARNWRPGSEARLVAALDPMIATFLQWTEDGGPNPQAWLSKRLEHSTERLNGSGLMVSAVIREGDPKDILTKEAELWNADCILVGARGLRGVGRFLLGSVSAAVLARASCSVEVVRINH